MYSVFFNIQFILPIQLAFFIFNKAFVRPNSNRIANYDGIISE